jgi:hypothetical protein
MPPFEAALMCAWLEANERKFAFMRLTLFQQLLDEFDAHPDDEDLDGARYFLETEGLSIGSKLDAVITLYREWEEQASKKGAAK